MVHNNRLPAHPESTALTLSQKEEKTTNKTPLLPINRSLVATFSLILKLGLLTGLTIIGFECINLFVIYRQVKLDYYLSLVALLFLVAGIWISKRQQTTHPPQARELPQELTLPAIEQRAPVIATQPSPATLSTNKPKNYLLTQREMEILQLIASGKTNKEIAALTFVELSTIKTHINNLYGKLDVTNRREAKEKYAAVIQQL